MANDDFIMFTLNLTSDQIQSLDSVLKNDTLCIRVTLSSVVSECPFCGGPVKSKGYSLHTYSHLPIASHPSAIEWRRRRYQCKDCGSSFSESNPFGPEHFRHTYALLDSVAKDLHNIHYSFRDIALKHRISEPLVRLYADSFLQVPRSTLPESLGIDEIHSKMAKYGGSYLAVLVDNVHRSLCDILPNRSKSTLSRYLEVIPLEERKRVKYVTIDLWEPYKAVALQYFPGCHVAADSLCCSYHKIHFTLLNI